MENWIGLDRKNLSGGRARTRTVDLLRVKRALQGHPAQPGSAPALGAVGWSACFTRMRTHQPPVTLVRFPFRSRLASQNPISDLLHIVVSNRTNST